MGHTCTFQSSLHNRTWIMNVSTVNIPAMWLLSSTSFSLSTSLIFSLPPYPIGFLSCSHLLIFTSLSLSANLPLPPSTFHSPSPCLIYHLPQKCSHLIFPSRNTFSSNHLRSPRMTLCCCCCYYGWCYLCFLTTADKYVRNLSHLHVRTSSPEETTWGSTKPELWFISLFFLHPRVKCPWHIAPAMWCTSVWTNLSLLPLLTCFLFNSCFWE